MNVHQQDLLNILREIRKELTAAQAKLTDAITTITALELPDAERPRCVECGITFRGSLSLAEHLYNHHNGPLPDHYLAAEQHDPLTAQPENEAAVVSLVVARAQSARAESSVFPASGGV